MTKDNIEKVAALEAIEKAQQTVSALCHGDINWIMSIPANPDKDPDLIITNALVAARKVIEAYESESGVVAENAYLLELLEWAVLQGCGRVCGATKKWIVTHDFIGAWEEIWAYLGINEPDVSSDEIVAAFKAKAALQPTSNSSNDGGV